MQKINLPKRKKFRKTKIQPFTDPARSRPKKAFDPSTIPVQGSLEQDESRRSGEEEGLRDVINEIEDRVDTQGEDVHLFSAPQPTGRSQAHTTRRHNEAESYKEFRESYAERFGSFSFEKLLEAKCTASRQALQQFVMSAARQAKCACCGMSAQECGDPVVHVPVKLLSLSHALDLEIPIYQCTRCSEAGVAGSKLFHVHPSMTGSVAGSALLGSNLLEGSYERERTWYDIELLEYLRLQRKNNARMAIDSFTQTMEELHRRNGQPFPPRDTVRRQLGRTLEEYENILFINNSEVRDTVEGTSLIDCCPACTGMPKEEGQDEQSPDVQRFQAYGDGNFRLPHLTTAGTATQHAPVIQHRLLPDSEVKEFCLQRPEDLPPIDDNTCNDFQADKQLGRTKQKFDITGVFGIFCRHGMLICALNMLTGERWSYATCLLHALLTANIAPSFWWYDINCRYKGHFLRWLQKCSLSEGMKTAAASMMFPLPTWHHSMHNAQCQATNSFRTMQGAGRGAGEPPEAAWAHFGPYGYILQYASLPARVAALERIAAYWNAAKLVQLPNLLLRMYIRAHTASEAAREEEAVVINLALQSGITEDQVVEAVIELKTARDTIAPLQALDWRAEYVDLLLQQADILKQVSSRVSPDMLSFSVSGSNRQSSVTRKIKVTNRIWHIERDHSIEESWQPGTAEYEDGLSRLRCSKLEAIQQQISELVQQLHLTEEHFQRQATQRGATKRLQNVKEQQRKKIQAALCFWTHWHAIAPVLEGPIPEQPQTEVRQETLHAACRGEYPWNNSNPNAGLLEVTAARCKTLGDIMDRCSEEMDLVEAEAAAACETLQKQQERIKARLVSLQLSIAGLENEATAQSSQLVDIAVAQSQCDRGKKLDGLKGMQSILIKKQSDLDRLKGSLCDVVVRLHYSAGIDHVPQIQGTTSDAELDAIRDEVYADHEDQIFESLDYCSDDE